MVVYATLLFDLLCKITSEWSHMQIGEFVSALYKRNVTSLSYGEAVVTNICRSFADTLIVKMKTNVELNWNYPIIKLCFVVTEISWHSSTIDVLFSRMKIKTILSFCLNTLICITMYYCESFQYRATLILINGESK